MKTMKIKGGILQGKFANSNQINMCNINLKYAVFLHLFYHEKAYFLQQNLSAWQLNLRKFYTKGEDIPFW